MKDRKINNRISVKNALLQLSKIYIDDIGDRVIVAEILDLKPELFSKKVPS
ncbi:MAG: hypothetical protein M0Z77_11930 [Thermoplasmatales archaeon]|nr:hypothetical protein [Thermoplasmatales archaeon]